VRYRVQAFAVPPKLTISRTTSACVSGARPVVQPESLAGECSPQIDVYETDDALEVVTDLPGVSPTSVHIVAKGDGLLIAGEKRVRVAPEAIRRFISSSAATALRARRPPRSLVQSGERAGTFAHGELRISIPKIDERRGRRIPIAIT
jgi:HSP20 family protein